ncbi:uncharacterized protein [Ptychodera flava]|uniref:uncharacterized protein n=1 Tax=Ptychodera flava TaxID=63121 RepID=UPI00396A469D
MQQNPLGKRPKKTKLARAYSTGYNIFSKDAYPNIRKANPGMPHIELMKIVGKHWKALDSANQDKYVKEALERREKRIADGSLVESCSNKDVHAESRGETSDQAINGPGYKEGKPDKLPKEKPAQSYDTTDVSMSMRSPFYRFYKRWSKRLSEKFKGKPKGSLKKCIVAKWQALPEDEKEPYKEPYRIRREAKRRRLLAERMRKSKIKTVRELLSEKRTDSETSVETIIDSGELENGKLDDEDALDLSRQPTDEDEFLKPAASAEESRQTPTESMKEVPVDSNISVSNKGDTEKSAPTPPPPPPPSQYAKKTKSRGRSRSPVSSEVSEGRVCTRYQAAASRRASGNLIEPYASMSTKKTETSKNSNCDKEASVQRRMS